MDQVSQPPYIYKVEFSIEDIDIHPEESNKLFQFQMQPGVALSITEDERIDAINCSEKKIKHTMFSMDENLLKADKQACIVAKKIEGQSKHVTIGTYKIQQLNECLQKLKSRYDEQQRKNEQQAVKSTTRITKKIRELAPFRNSDNRPCGSLDYILKFTCCGPHVEREHSCNSEFEGFMADGGSTRSKAREERRCLSKCEHKDDFNEYVAEVNGNSLIIRVSKNNPYLVTRVFDSCDSDKLTIRGCNQQIDFKFPTNFICCKCQQTFGTCRCVGDSHLTDFQKRTSCVGSSFKNSLKLPVIRGNLKYPGRFEYQTIGFDVANNCSSTNDATERYRVKAERTRNACLQVDEDNVAREVAGYRAVPKGIKMCKVSCEKDSDVFVLKMGRKGKTRDGKDHEIELEMRTPRGPSIGPKKMETREIQVVEEEFEDTIRKRSEEEEKEKAKEQENEKQVAAAAVASKKKKDGKGKVVGAPTKTGKKPTPAAAVVAKRK